MKLSQKQMIFAQNIASLIRYAHLKGYEVTIGEVYRPSYVQKFLIKIGKSWTKSSQHSIKMACDLNLFKDGKYLSRSEAHRVLGKQWEKLNPYNVWGGRFRDGNHYEMRHDYTRKTLRGGKYKHDL